MFKKSWGLISTVILLSVITACGGTNTGEGVKRTVESANEKATLRFAFTGNEPEFKARISENPKVKERFPNVTFEYTPVAKLQENIAANQIPDVVNVTGENFFEILKYNLGFDMRDLTKKYNLDLSKFKPEQMEMIGLFSKENKIMALPDKMNFPFTAYALVYNKDIFDKFAIPYPKEGMSWEDTIELAKKFVRSDNGIEYKGLISTNTSVQMMKQRALDLTNSKEKVDLSSPEWQKIFSLSKLNADIQGGWILANNAPVAQFMKDRNIAMYAGVIHQLVSSIGDSSDQPNWDMVSYPVFEDRPGIVPAERGVYAITSTSKNKDIAFQVLKLALEQEVDRIRYETLTTAQKNMNAIKNKKMAAYFPHEFAQMAYGLINSKTTAMTKEGKDVNTALRELEVEMQKKFDEAKQ